MQNIVNFLDDLDINSAPDVQRARTRLSSFVQAYEYPSSMAVESGEPQNFSCLTALLTGVETAKSEGLVTLVLKVLLCLDSSTLCWYGKVARCNLVQPYHL